jgi:uncharacterized protein (TIGR02217 family)
MAFIETPRFPDDISYGSSGGPKWNTDILILKSGYESRNANWGQMRYKYNAAMGVRDNSQLDDLIHWFNAMQGRQHGFRFKDWTDYTSSDLGTAVTPLDQLLGTGNGVLTQFQIVKTYTQGSQSRVRTITKLVTATVKVAVNEVEVTTGFTVNYNTGIITFTSPVANGHTVKAGYEFDVPVRFDTDELSIAIEHYQTGTLSVPIVELRV